MDRRTFFGTIGVTATIFPGCLANGSFSDASGRDDKPQKYEKCPNEIIGINHLPEPAKNETMIALEKGIYETKNSLILDQVMDINNSYLRYDGEYYEYYKPAIKKNGDIISLHLSQAHPETNEELTVVNNVEEGKKIKIDIEFNNEGVLTEEFRLESNEEVTISDEVNFKYGVYNIKVTTEKFSEEVEWEINEFGSNYHLSVNNKGINSPGAEIEHRLLKCKWDANGDVTQE